MGGQAIVSWVGDVCYVGRWMGFFSASLVEVGG